MIARPYGFPTALEESLESYFRRQKLSLRNLEPLAPQVRALADHYTGEEGARTPWDFASAYMAYYFPLNVARLQSVFEESFRQFPWDEVTSIVDFGSGPGTTHAALEATSLTAKPIVAIETDDRAARIHREMNLRKWPCEWRSNLPTRIAPGTLGIFCYSLLEEPAQVRRLAEFDHLLIVTPSTRQQGRRLLEIRGDLSGRGFSSWAPCTHQSACPLLEQSKSDWCHDRIAFVAPDWFAQLERALPFQNRTLTFSYWFGSRREPPVPAAGIARIVGDTLMEKGKTRQMVCRGPNREFLSWLKRDGPAPQLPRGSLVALSSDLQVKGNELRGFRHN